MPVLSGLDRLTSDPSVQGLIRGRRVGLLAHAASVNSSFKHAKDIVGELAELRVLFAPEHGFFADAQDMEHVGAAETGGLRVVSLYGEWPEQLAPNPDDLADLDAVIIDLQDIGSRYYTYVWTAAFMLRVCARLGVQVIILDRPNPLGGLVTEGKPQGTGYRSFVGMYPLPIRHGLTIGEILRFVAEHEKIDERAFEVVSMEGWRRDMFFDDTGLPWVLPSPNMPTLDTAIVYPGGCLVEGTTLSEGRGTTRPFEFLGVPSIDEAELVRRVNVEGAVLRPVRFVPTARKHAGAVCSGVQVHVTDRSSFRSVELYLRLICEMTLLRQDLDIDAGVGPWRTEPYEYERHRPAMDLLAGDCTYRQLVNDRVVLGHDGAALEEYIASHRAAALAFDSKCFWIYPE